MAVGTDDSSVNIRDARPSDAVGMARTYVESWRDTYAGTVPEPYLLGMSVDREAMAWRRRLRAADPGALRVVADRGATGIVGLGEAGLARQGLAGYRGEIFTLYVHPSTVAQGIGRALLRGLAQRLLDRGIDQVMVWVLADNPARWFYEVMGGRLVARREIPFAGIQLPALAYGWSDARTLAGSTEPSEF